MKLFYPNKKIQTMNIEQALNKFGERKIEEIANEFKNRDKVATGKLNKSLRYELQKDEGNMNYLLSFFGEEYIHYVAGGRAPGKYPNIDNILIWMKARGIDENKLFLILNKIKDEGMQPDATLSQILSQEYYTDFAGLLKNEMVVELQNQINRFINQINNKNTI